jgi:nitroreductase
MDNGNLKSIAKNVLGEKGVAVLKNKTTNIRLSKQYKHDKYRFYTNFSNEDKNNLGQINAKLIFRAHQIEKGLSHRDFRASFGKGPLEVLSQLIATYNESGFPKDGKAYVNALSVLHAYIDKHNDLGEKLPEQFNTWFGNVMDEIEACTSTIAGVSMFTREEKENNHKVDYKTLFENRHATREFSDEPVDLAKVKNAIQISMKTPSVCNRQSSRVRVITNPDKIRDALNVQGGFTGYKMPPCLILVTTDTSSFIGIGERNQVYTDGGLFSMSLMNGLEYEGLGVCPLHAMFEIGTECQIREILDVPMNENLIMFMVVGNFNEENYYCKSFRYDAEDVTKVID